MAFLLVGIWWPFWQVHVCVLSHLGKSMCFFRCIAILASSCLCFKPPWQVHVFFPMYSHFGKFMFVF